MKIFVQAVPNSKQAKVVKISANQFSVKIDAPAEQDKANQRLIEILADYFQTNKSSIRIVHGCKSRNKLIEIL